jgi:hypothetical protein
MTQQVSVSGDHALAPTGDRAFEHAVVVLIIGHDAQALGRHHVHAASVDVGAVSRQFLGGALELVTQHTECLFQYFV